MADSSKKSETVAEPQVLPRQQDRSYDLRGMAHELRTPISAIIAFAEMIEREQFGPVGDERYRAYARDIQEAARLSLGVVAAGLEQSSESGELLLQPASEVDCELVAQSLMRMFAGPAREAGIELSFEASSVPLKIVTDEALLKQILLNLVGNAIKFTPPGGSVSLAAQVNDDRPCIVVTDTGLGMTRFDTDILLGNNGRGEEVGGGIGFTTVRRLSGLLGADLKVASQRGAGTSVSLIFGKPTVSSA